MFWKVLNVCKFMVLLKLPPFSNHLTRYTPFILIVLASMSHLWEINQRYTYYYFRKMKEYMPISLDNIIIDFEDALNKSLKLSYPLCLIHDCNFHFGQWSRWIFNQMDFLKYKEKSWQRTILQKCLNIPYFPISSKIRIWKKKHAF